MQPSDSILRPWAAKGRIKQGDDRPYKGMQPSIDKVRFLQEHLKQHSRKDVLRRFREPVQDELLSSAKITKRIEYHNHEVSSARA